MYFGDNLDKIIASLNKFAFANKDILIKNNATISGSFALYLQFYEPCEDDDFDIDIDANDYEDEIYPDEENPRGQQGDPQRCELQVLSPLHKHLRR